VHCKGVIVPQSALVRTLRACIYIPAGELSRRLVRLDSVNRTIARMRKEQKRLHARVAILRWKLEGDQT
jgi:hypothetical protein